MTNNNWNDFNDAESQQSGFDLIPKGTVVPVRMTLKPGGYDNPEQGWGGGYASESFDTGSVYLAAEFVVTAGDHAKRKMWSNIGLFSKKGPTWGQMGRSFIRAALNSARNVHPQDNSPQNAIMNDHNTGIAGEPMVDAKQAAAALRLPYYWFADQAMRSKYRIPHYLLGGLVRYRMSELSVWAAGSQAETATDAPDGEVK